MVIDIDPLRVRVGLKRNGSLILNEAGEVMGTNCREGDSVLDCDCRRRGLRVGVVDGDVELHGDPILRRDIVSGEETPVDDAKGLSESSCRRSLRWTYGPTSFSFSLMVTCGFFGAG